MTDERFLKSGERAVYALRSLYRRYGYLPYKMNKFEEYGLYAHNKDFLVSDRVITFNDTDGSLMALKPDVTLSIVRSYREDEGKRKVCYNESVYRVTGRAGRFCEQMQSGLECVGDIDDYDIFEVVFLAAKSLSLISDSYVLELSHLGLLSSLLEEACDNPDFVKSAAKFISEKNSHDLKKLCDEYITDADAAASVVSLASLYGSRSSVLERLRGLCGSRVADRLSRLERLDELLTAAGVGDNVTFDLSVVNDMNYYNGVVFRGFVDGICDSVLSGGQYDSLMRRLGKNAGAVGFAVYIDMLEQLGGRKAESDVDVVVLYDDTTDKAALADTVRSYAEGGGTVTAEKCLPPKLTYTKIVDLRGKGQC